MTNKQMVSMIKKPEEILLVTKSGYTRGQRVEELTRGLGVGKYEIVVVPDWVIQAIRNGRIK
jgi:hypothetical protein